MPPDDERHDNKLQHDGADKHGVRWANDCPRDESGDAAARRDDEHDPRDESAFCGFGQAPPQDEAGGQPEHVDEAVLTIDARNGRCSAGSRTGAPDNCQQAGRDRNGTEQVENDD